MVLSKNMRLCYVVTFAEVKLFRTQDDLLVLGLWLFEPIGFVQFNVTGSVCKKFCQIEVDGLSIKIRNF
jgi:hypothetical protein